MAILNLISFKLKSHKMKMVKILLSLQTLGFIRVIKTTEVISMINQTYKMTFLNNGVKQPMSHICVLTISQI